MRGTSPVVAPIEVAPGYRMAEQEEESQSSSSNSPTRADYEESDFFAANNDSQSSIGVPTFQDMAVTEEPCPPINMLPAEVMIGIFSKLGSPVDLLSSMLVCKMWARNSVGLLWHRPACTSWTKHTAICHTLSLERPYFEYRDFIKRLNLAALSDRVNDGSVAPLGICTTIERLTLTNCQGLTDHGLIELIKGNSRLLALDISGDTQITEVAINVLADECPRLQGLNITGCGRISNESMIKVAENCRSIKRLKLNDCDQMEDSAIVTFARNCPNILEIDLHQCLRIGNEPITELVARGHSLRELRLANCENLTDRAFLSLPPRQTYEALRILDLTSCVQLTDLAVEKIISVAPRLRNLVLAKCRNITDAAVHAISKLGKNLHYVHLGHCGHVTDTAVKALVVSCTRIRYIDLGCCAKLTDESVEKLAMLPKLRRIGLVKCNLITNKSVLALSHRLPPTTSSAAAAFIPHSSSLERVHLSYCTNLTLDSIIVLLNSCPRLTHLSLTGVQAFLRSDLEEYCREAPAEFTPHQREVFCVFSGQGVMGLRRYLNNERALRRTQGFDDDDVTLNGDEDDQTMTGMMSATGINGGADEEEEEADEELEDGDDAQNAGGGAAVV